MDSSAFFNPAALHALDFLSSLYIAVALLVIRYVSEMFAIPALTAYLERIKGGDKKVAIRVYDDFFIAACSYAVEALALSAMLLSNYGCLPWSTDSCFAEWPNHQFSALQRWHYIAMFGYYLSELLSTVLNFGTILKMEMIMHHFVSMALISLSYISNNLRFGVMWMALFDISNPILHTAKMLHPIQTPGYQKAANNVFMIFALVFFVVRVVMGPYSILRPVTSLYKIASFAYATTFNGLAFFVYGLQLLWFYKIYRLAAGGGGSKKKGEHKVAEKEE